MMLSSPGQSQAAVGDTTTIDPNAPTTTVDPNAPTTTVDPNAPTTTVDPNAPTTTVDPNATTTTTGAGATTTAAGATTTVGATTTTGVTTTTTTIAAVPQCRPDGLDCIQSAMSVAYTDVNGDKVLDQFDIINVTVTVTALRSGVTSPVVSIPLPLGSGHRFVAGSLAVNGTTAGALGASVATVALPSPLSGTSTITVGIVLGDHVSPDLARAPISLTSQLTALDATQPLIISLVSNQLEVAQRITDLNVTLKVTARPTVGGTVAFQADIINQGPDTATAASAAFQLPAVADLTTVVLIPGCRLTGVVVSCALGDIPPTFVASPVISFRLLPTAVSGSSIDVSVTVTNTTFDSNTANNRASVSAPLDKADLKVSFAGLDGPAVAGDVLPFSILISNAGPTDASGVQLDAVLPLTPRPITPSGPFSSTCTFNSPTGALQCPNLSIPVGQTRQIDFAKGVVAYRADLTKTLDFSAKLTLADPASDPNKADNAVAKSVSVVGHTNLSIVFVNTPERVTAGQKISLALTAGNAGPSPSGAVEVEVTLDQALVGLAGSIGGQPCSVTNPTTVLCSTNGLDVGVDPTAVTISGSIPSGANYTGVTANARIFPGATPILDVAPFDDNTAAIVVAVRGFADVRAAVTAPKTALAGQQVSFTVEVTNDGPSDALGTTLVLSASDALQRLVVLGDDSPSAVCTTAGGSPTCGPFTVRAGATRTFTVTGDTSPDVALAASVSVKASVTASTLDTDLTNNVAFDSVDGGVSLSSLLAVSVSSNPSDIVTAGGPVSYEIIITNSGKTRTDGATVQVRPPDGFGGGAPNGCVDDGGRTWVCSTGPIAANGSARINVFGTASAALPEGALFFLRVVAIDSTDKSEHAAETSARVQVVANVTADAVLDESVVSGNSFGLRYTVTNAGPSNAVNVTVVVDLPAGARLETQDRCAPEGAGVLRCVIGPMNPVGSATIDLRFTSDADLEDNAKLTYRSTLSWNDRPPVVDRRTITVLSRADLKIGWNAPPTAVAGKVTATSIELTNLGPSISKNVQITLAVTDVVGAMRTNPSTADVVCGDIVSRTVTCRVARLKPGGTITIGVDLPVASDAPDPSLLEGSLVLASATKDPQEPNNHAALSVAVSAEANLVVTIDAPAEVRSATVTPVSISVKNNGPSFARNAKVEVLVPPKLASLFAAGVGLDCQRDGASELLRCNVGTLKNGGEVSLRLQAVIDVNAVTGIDEPFQATASSSTYDQVLANNQNVSFSRLVGRATSRRDVGDLGALKKVGNTVVLNAEIKNLADETAEHIFFVQDIPVGQRLVAAESTQGHCGISLRMVLCYVKDIPGHKSVGIEVTTVVNAVSDDVPVITMAAYSSDADPTTFVKTDDAFVRPKVNPTAGLEVKSTSPQSVRPLTTANAPLFSGLGLSVLFGLGLVGWVRRGRREDPLLQLA
jgi:large repetitive protein